MEVVTVLYPNKDGGRFDFEYYMKKHVPWVAGLLGKSIEVRRGLASPTGASAHFVCMATINVNSIDEFQPMFAKHGPKILDDLRNFTNIEPMVQFDEVLT